MQDDPVISALDHVDLYGDVTPGRSHAPATVALRARLQREHLAVYDHERGRFVLTHMGRQRRCLRPAPRPPAEIRELRPPARQAR